MISTSQLGPARLQTLRQGQLFISVHRPEKFLFGRINGVPVLMLVEGEKPFHTDDVTEWSRGSGLAVSDVRFEVDPQAGTPAREGASVGTLVIGKNGLFVMGQTRTGVHEVNLDREESALLADDDVAFTAWRIVTGPDKTPIELFRRSGGSVHTVELSGR